MKQLANMCRRCGRIFQSPSRMKECPACKSKDMMSWTYGTSPRYGMPLVFKIAAIVAAAIGIFICVALIVT